MDTTFEALVDRHRNEVFRVCRSIVRDEHLGSDATQETFLRLWNRIASGRAPRAIRLWLRRVAVTTSIDLLRGLERQPNATWSEEPAGATPGSGTLEQVAQAELMRRFERALVALPEGQRTVFLLRHSGGLSLSEVADALGLALPTVKTQFARAALKLQRALQAFQPGRDDV